MAVTGLGPVAVAHAAPGCAEGWQAEAVAADLGGLENLEADGAGGFYVTGIVRGELLHVGRDGRVTTVLTGLDNPAGLRLSGGHPVFRHR
ncbi:hypothetical protein ACIGO9_14245 [Nocardia asteroides]|uniref:hypothetical protein n=1 Tax=Nocardia asteroides TaxID=1824 RepID=UPI0037CB0AAB